MIVGFCRDTAVVCSLSVNEKQVKLPVIRPQEKNIKAAYVVSFAGNHFIKISCGPCYIKMTDRNETDQCHVKMASISLGVLPG